MTLAPGELCVVPRGVEHRTLADTEAEVLIFEPAATRNTGNVADDVFTAPPGVGNLTRMEFIQGTVTHCQHTLGIYGSAVNRNLSSSAGSYITLFRVNGRPVELRTPRPTSLADGDQVIAAGPRQGHAVEALACENLTTRETATADFWGNAFAAVFGTGITVVVDVICIVEQNYWWLLLTPVLLLIALLCANRAWLVHRATQTVAMAVSHGTVRRL